MSGERRKRVVEYALELLRGVYPRQSPLAEPMNQSSDWPICSDYQPHVEMVTSIAYTTFEGPDLPYVLAEILADVSWYVWERGIRSWTLAIDYAEKCLAICDELKDDKYSATRIKGLYILLSCYFDSNHFAKSLEYAKPYLAAAQNIYDNTGPTQRTEEIEITLANGYNNVAITLAEQDKFDEALTLHYQSLSIKESWRDKSDMRCLIALTYCGLGILYLRKAKKQQNEELRTADLLQAREYMEDSISMHREVFGKTHQRTALYMFWLGMVQRAQNLFEEALTTFKATLNIQKQSLGDHIETGSTNFQVGSLLKAEGRVKESL